jgi:D-aminopeptidase
MSAPLASRLLMCVVALLGSVEFAQAAERARDVGVPFEGTPGPLNAITDVTGVEVGHLTLIQGDGLLKVGAGPVRSGVTVVLPRGRASADPVYGGYYDLNGNGEMTGISYLQDFGVIYGPIGISNTNAIGQVYAGIQQWTQQKFGEASTPVVAETFDGRLNDIGGFHVHAEHVVFALDAAKSGAVPEGNVGGGTGMVCFGFKGGIGTASRQVSIGQARYTVGVLVQCNTGDRMTLRVAGAPVGQELAGRWLPCYASEVAPADKKPVCEGNSKLGKAPGDSGSIIIVVATDAPLIPTQLNRVAKRAALGLGRLGSYSGNSSGDLIVSFTTSGVANYPEQKAPSAIAQIASTSIDPLFKATVEATEEAIVNALIAADTMTGINGQRFYRMPHGELRDILKRYGRLDAPKKR